MLLAPSQPHSPSFLPTRTSRRIVCPSFDLTGRVIVRPAAKSRDVQRHNHARNVLRALHARPTPLSFGTFTFACILLVPPLYALLPPGSYLASRIEPACPLFDLAACVIVQPAAESRHVQSHNHVWHVWGALSTARCLHATAPPSLSGPADTSHLAPIRTPSFRLGRRLRHSTSR